jgi:K+-sensing histidine kinase KdpD
MSEQDTLAIRLATQEDELRRLRQELDQMRRRRSSLLAMASHDLRTPLTIIQGYSQLLAADLTDTSNPVISESLLNIMAHADVLGNMVEDLMTLDQIEYGALRLSLDSWDFDDLIAQAVAQIESLVLVKNIAIEHHRAASPVRVQADDSHIRRALYNLLSHAIKYARPGSALSIATDHRAGFGRVSLRDPQRRLGPEVLAHLFDLAGLNPDDNPSLRSMDLGLVLARRVAEAHDGRAGATWEPESGTTLYIDLQVAEG